MAIIINEEQIRKDNFDNQKSHTMKVYKNHGVGILEDKSDDRAEDQSGCIVSLSAPQYEGTAARENRKNKIEDCLKLYHKVGIKSFPDLVRNITHLPDGASDLWDMLRIDISAQILTSPDKTPYIATMMQNDMFTNPFNPQWLYDYEAYFDTIDGRGQNVPMVNITTGDTASIYFSILGCGFQQDLYNQLFNNIFSALKVTRAITNAYIDRKNDMVYAPVFAFGYPAGKQVAADTAGGTYEEQMYNTWNTAIETLGLLRDFLTGEYIDVTSGLSIICHSTRIRAINRAINGQLTPGSNVRNLNALNEIARIIPYNTKYQTYINERITYQGCAEDTAYLFVPNRYFWLAMKRDLTHVVGPGNTFAIDGQKEAWYFVPTVWHRLFFGGSDTDLATSTDPHVMTQEYGYIIEITLPESDAS